VKSSVVGLLRIAGRARARRKAAGGCGGVCAARGGQGLRSLTRSLSLENLHRNLLGYPLLLKLTEVPLLL